jgi:hypothetical protein
MIKRQKGGGGGGFIIEKENKEDLRYNKTTMPLLFCYLFSYTCNTMLFLIGTGITLLYHHGATKEII